MYAHLIESGKHILITAYMCKRIIIQKAIMRDIKKYHIDRTWFLVIEISRWNITYKFDFFMRKNHFIERYEYHYIWSYIRI